MIINKKIFYSVGAVLSILIVLGYLVHSRYDRYNYKTDINSHFTMNKEYVKVATVPIVDGRVQINNTIKDTNTTLFLKVHIQSNILGYFFKPSITISSRDKKIVQTFEYAASGTRYINITNIFKNGDENISLDTQFLTLEQSSGELYTFDPILIKNKTILIIAPHPDDAEIAAYGLYSDNAKDTYIVTVSAGEYGETIYNSFYQDKQKKELVKGKIRTYNSLTVSLMGGRAV